MNIRKLQVLTSSLWLLQRKGCGCVDNRNWRSSEVQWQYNCHNCPAGMKPSRRHHSDSYGGHMFRPQSDYRHGQTVSNGMLVWQY